MLDILCVGDAKLDIFIQIPNDNPHFSLDEKSNKLLISFGEKISVKKHFLDTGGNAANVSVGMSRLGIDVGLCAEIGRDEFSQKILNKLSSEKINTDFLLQTKNEESSFSVSLGYKKDRVLFTEHAQRNHNFNFNKLQTKHIFLTSLGNIWEKTYEEILKFTGENNTKLSFNPGTLQLEKRDKLIMDIIEKTDYLFVNKEEAEEILYGKELGIRMGNDESVVKKLLFGLNGLGAKNVIITDSDNGSYLMDENNNFYHTGIIKVDVVEKTGAGDAYTAGFLAAIINNFSSKDAMVWGTINSSSVIQKIGAENGLLNKTGIEEGTKNLNRSSPKLF